MSLGLATRGYTGTRGALALASIGYTPVVGPYVPPPPQPIVEKNQRRRVNGRSSQRDSELRVAAFIKSVNDSAPLLSISGHDVKVIDENETDVTVRVIFENHDIKTPIVIIATPIKV